MVQAGDGAMVAHAALAALPIQGWPALPKQSAEAVLPLHQTFHKEKINE